jgi:DNA-binding GntR family transcriptional regulator
MPILDPGALSRASQVLGDMQPRYATVALAIAADILEGKRQVGALLPPEGELCAAFGVSRSTVREALRRLRDQGLVASARGVGSRIIADRPRSNYVLAARSAADVMGYSGPTRLEITGRRTVRAAKELADRLGCDPGLRWRHITGVRWAEPQRTAISCVELYIAAEFGAVANSPELVTTPAYRLIARDMGIAVTEIRQDIGAIALDEAQAQRLGGAAGGPGLYIRRRFYAADGKLLEATLNIHAAADRFAYSLRLGSLTNED